jgi:hypothetical protein
MLTRPQIVTEARRWVDVPFVDGHFHYEVGCDCLGMGRGVGIALGLDWLANPAFAPFLGYARQPDPVKMKEALDRFLTPLVIGEEQAGDILYWSILGLPTHLAILTEEGPDRGYAEGSMVHAYAPSKKVVEHRIDAKWRSDSRRLVGVYAFPGVE